MHFIKPDGSLEIPKSQTSKLEMSFSSCQPGQAGWAVVCDNHIIYIYIYNGHRDSGFAQLEHGADFPSFFVCFYMVLYISHEI